MRSLTIRGGPVLLLALAAAAIVAAACGSGSSAEGPGIRIDLSTPGPTRTATGVATSAATAAATTTPGAPPVVRGLAMPIEGACLPTSDDLMPNAPRDYREGTHEGVDLYSFGSCVEITRGTPVRAVKTGRVVRADWNYQELTPESLAAVEARVANGEAGVFEVVDTFRGRQVWLDHGGGLISRYAHLSAIEESVFVGKVVTAGTVIGYVGDSGTPESVREPGTEDHLHFEIRVRSGYLGEGLPPADVRALYEGAFAGPEAP